MGTIKYKDLKAKLLADPETKKEYENLAMEFNKTEKSILEGLEEAVKFAKGELPVKQYIFMEKDIKDSYIRFRCVEMTEDRAKKHNFSLKEWLQEADELYHYIEYNAPRRQYLKG